jgi:hypothetical protein
MNQVVELNDFRRGLKKLLAEIEKELTPIAPNPYQGACNQVLHEHDTRTFFFDRFLTLLGWSLGMGGNVAEEARIKAATTRFIDYVGVNDTSPAPVLMLEAKAWDKPIVRAAVGKAGATKRELIVQAIHHICGGGFRGTSPVVGEWHDYLEQVRRYVQIYKENHCHEIPIAVLASGKWFVIFTSPVRTFIDGQVNDEQFRIFEGEEILAEADQIYRLLNKVRLGGTAPIYIRPAQLGIYLTAVNIAAVFHGLLVCYRSTGAAVFAQIPQILVYPALLLQRDDGTIFTVIDREQPNYMSIDKEYEEDDGPLTTHLNAVADEAARLLQVCSDELCMPLVPFELSDFPGFGDGVEDAGGGALRLGGQGKAVLRPLGRGADEWIVTTGTLTHYLLSKPVVSCRFHAWGQCRGVGRQIGPSAVGTPTTETPRSFFVDGQRYHCAHQIVQDRRSGRCHIAPLDMRTCCRVCGLHAICWSDEDIARLPCGT